MATNQPTNPADENNREDGSSTPMLDAATYGQTLDPENDGQQMADQMDDSLRIDTEAMTKNGPAPASDENLPRELTKPSDTNYTLPEMQEE